MVWRRHGRVWVSACLMLAMLSWGMAAQARDLDSRSRRILGPKFNHPELPAGKAPPRYRPPLGVDHAGRILWWNQVALDANALDHVPTVLGESRIFGEQLGPARTARAFAIVHIAIFDAVNAVAGGYHSYTGIAPRRGSASIDAAIAQAAHDTLVELYPSQAATFDALLVEDLRRIPNGRLKTNGIELGRQAAAAILALRADDGSQHPEPIVGVDYFPSDEPGKWRPDPVSMSPLALGAFWGGGTPFVLRSSRQFRAPPPPSLQSLEYAAAFNQVKRLGGDGVTTPTKRTREQTVIGIYWAYDGTPWLGAPPRLYNQIAVQIASMLRSNAPELARLLALVNTAMADAALSVWETKYHYEFWRPVTGIREADRGTGPTGDGDGNPLTAGDPGWTPLGSPASNFDGPDFTPPFPAYTSSHAGLGAAAFQTLRSFYRTDCIRFTFVSDEYNGVTRDNTGEVRPLIPRTFSSLSEAEEENGQSRIYLGIHWSFDKTEGIAQGQSVANYVYDNAFRPLWMKPRH